MLTSITCSKYRNENNKFKALRGPFGDHVVVIWAPDQLIVTVNIPHEKTGHVPSRHYFLTNKVYVTHEINIL